MGDEVYKSFLLDKIPLDRKMVLLSQEESCESMPFIHALLAYTVKEGRRIFLVSLNQNASHYHAIGTRLGWNSQTLTAKQLFTCLDGLDLLKSSLNGNSSPFGSLFEDTMNITERLYLEIQRVLTSFPEDDKFVLIIDNLSNLLYLGVPLAEIAQLVQLCHGLCIRLNGSIIASVRSSPGDPELQKLSTLLLHWADLGVRVSGLTTGFSKDLSGSVTLRWSVIPEEERFYHYKIFDRGVRLFAPGTSSAVL